MTKNVIHMYVQFIQTWKERLAVRSDRQAFIDAGRALLTAHLDEMIEHAAVWTRELEYIGKTIGNDLEPNIGDKARAAIEDLQGELVVLRQENQRLRARVEALQAQIDGKVVKLGC
ncbi:MAG TPA: hypothetical protein VGF39_16530 [Stellaceae bacterium]|jgi:hypothetical protein